MLALCACARSTPVAVGTATVTSAELLKNLPLLDPSVHVHLASSHAPNGSNTTDFAHPIRTDAQGRYVLMEASGPGAINRIWFTPFAVSGDRGDPAGIGQIQIFFDGETTPRIDLPAAEFFSGATAPFLAPVCGNFQVSSGGNYCNLRMPFRKSVKFTASVQTSYYDIGYETYADDTPVETFDPAAASTLVAARATAALYARAGTALDLPGGSRSSGNSSIAAGGERTIASIDHAGTIDAIEIELDPHDDASLRSVWLEAHWDGEAAPSVAAPLADLFLSGAGERAPASALLAGYSPQRHLGYLYFPMPFARSAQLKLVNRGAGSVSASWSIGQSAYSYSGEAGQFHATYAEDPATALGRDYILLDAAGAGKIVGLSFTESGPLTSASTVFMEGDERVYFDGSRTPDLYGTGTEDIFSGAYYYATGAFTLPDHGATAVESLPGGGVPMAQTAQYRLLLSDPWPFRDGIRFGIEHGAGDGIGTAAHSVVLWYGRSRPAMRQTDAIIVGDAASELAAGYVSAAGAPVSLTAFFEGDADGDISSLVQDATNLGALPAPPGTDPMGESVAASGRTHAVDEAIHFNINIDSTNRGVILRRLLDQDMFGQRAEVRVNGIAAGAWFTPGMNASKRWAESDYALPAALTAGKSRVAIELRIVAAEEAPSGARTGWTDFSYTAYSIQP